MKLFPAGTALVMKFNLPANDCNSQLVAFLALIILTIIPAMSCSLSSGIWIIMCSVSNVSPKNSTTVQGLQISLKQ